MATTYKDKADFYLSNGSPQLDIYVAISSTLFGYLLWRKWGCPGDVISEFLLLVMPIIISYSLPDPEYGVLFLVLLLALALLVKASNKRTTIDGSEVNDEKKGKLNATTSTAYTQNDTMKPSYISVFRAFLQLLTIIAILAVDFQLFPRKFAKTNDYGFSLVRHSFLHNETDGHWRWIICIFARPRQYKQDKTNDILFHLQASVYYPIYRNTADSIHINLRLPRTYIPRRMIIGKPR